VSGIVLTASVRQNLLSLQSTASLLATTQNDLSTGNKVNSALDNPTNYFTAQSLNNRASDIGNLLDSIGNGVQVLQAANTGITSLQSLVDSAKSIANQVLQSPVGYTTKSGVTSAAIAGATASDLLGTATVSSGTFTGAVIANKNSSTTTNLNTALTTGGAGSDSILAQPPEGSTLVINGQTITFTQLSPTTPPSSNGNTLNLNTTNFSNLIASINAITGTTTASLNGSGQLVLNTGTGAGITVGGTALSVFGLSSGGTSSSLATPVTGLSSGGTTLTGASVPPLQGETLTIGATGGGTATNITFGSGAGQVSTLDQLNTALAVNNLQATIDATGNISITTTNDAASATIGPITGTAAGSGQVFNGLTAAAPVTDPNSQATRASLVAQYDNVLAQIDSTAQDASFNGVNLLNGDTLKLVFDETGKSTLSITGTTFNSTGLGLSTLTAGTDFIDNNSANKVLGALDSASDTLRSEASTLGSNLSIVQVRQDFNKNLINVLQTGSSNLTLADTNELAADSQALSTRQSIAVSALSLANQSQASVLQLLR
jgi:flagellin-like hook-associated protein FlgL